MFGLTLRRLFVALDWLLLFGLACVFLLVVVAPLVGDIVGRTPFLSILTSLAGLALAAAVATIINRPLRRALLGLPTPTDPASAGPDAAERGRRIRPRLALLALALLLAVPLGVQLLGNRGAPTAARPGVGGGPSPAAAPGTQGPDGSSLAGPSRPAPTRQPEGPVAPAAPTSPPSSAPTTLLTSPATVSPITLPTSPATVSPTAPPTVAPTSLPTATTPPAPSVSSVPTGTTIPEPTVLLADNFDDPAAGKLAKTSPLPADYAVGYVDGEYTIRKLVADWPRSPAVPLPGRYADSVVRVDARLIGEALNRYLVVACRDQGVSDSNYRLSIAPSDGSFSLARWDSGREVRLVDWQISPAIKTGNQSNRLELVCVGSKIAAIVNGTQVAAVSDATYKEGAILLMVSNRVRFPVTIDSRWDNLVLLRP